MKILLVRLDHTGDCVMTVPAVAKALHQVYPALELDVLVSKSNAQLLGEDPHISRVVAYDAPWSVPSVGFRYTPRLDWLKRLVSFTGVRKRALRKDYDTIIYLSFSYWERWLTVGLSSRRLGFSGPYRAWLFKRSCSLLTHGVPFDESEHALSNCYRLVEILYPLERKPMASPIRVSSRAAELAKEKLETLGCDLTTAVGVHPGAHTSTKRWPSERFGELAALLCKDPERSCVVVAAPTEGALVEEVVKMSGHKNVRPLLAATMEEFAAITTHLKLLVTNDGGPAHVAACLGVPTVAVFGPSDERIFRPLGDRVRVVRKEDVPGPCAWPWVIKRPCCEKQACLRELSVERVAEEALELLASATMKGEKPCLK